MNACGIMGDGIIIHCTAAGIGGVDFTLNLIGAVLDPIAAVTVSFIM